MINTKNKTNLNKKYNSWIKQQQKKPLAKSPKKRLT
jgi:hypothetical protein